MRTALARGLRRAFVVWLGFVVAAVVLQWLPVNVSYVR